LTPSSVFCGGRFTTPPPAPELAHKEEEDALPSWTRSAQREENNFTPFEPLSAEEEEENNFTPFEPLSAEEEEEEEEEEEGHNDEKKSGPLVVDDHPWRSRLRVRATDRIPTRNGTRYRR
jgi:hypothetical protein